MAVRALCISLLLLAFTPLSNAQMGPPGNSSQAPHTLPPGRVRISGGVMAAQAVQHDLPIYPHYPPGARISGATVLHVVIGRDGTVLEASVISGPQDRRDLDRDAVMKWTYKPYLLNGQPVEVDTTVTLQPGFGG